MRKAKREGEVHGGSCQETHEGKDWESEIDCNVPPSIQQLLDRFVGRQATKRITPLSLKFAGGQAAVAGLARICRGRKNPKLLDIKQAFATID